MFVFVIGIPIALLLLVGVSATMHYRRQYLRAVAALEKKATEDAVEFPLPPPRPPPAAKLPAPVKLPAPGSTFTPAKPDAPAKPAAPLQTPVSKSVVTKDPAATAPASHNDDAGPSQPRTGQDRTLMYAPRGAACSSSSGNLTQLARKSAQQRAQTDRPKGKASLPDPTVLPPPTPSILANRSVGQRDVKHV